MANVLITYRHYPVSVGRFFKSAFRYLGHNVVSYGFDHGAWIPWPDAPLFYEYIDSPSFALDRDVEVADISHALFLCKNSGFSPDVIVQIDAGFWVRLDVKVDVPVVHVATDPHFLFYGTRAVEDGVNTGQRAQADVFFNMQHSYIGHRKLDRWLPYAFDHKVHYFKPMPMKYLVCFIGVRSSPTRNSILDWLNATYHPCFINSGIIYEECNDIYNESLVAINISTGIDTSYRIGDLPMRFWEDMARRRLVCTNRQIGDLAVIDDVFGIKEDVHYVAFGDIAELREKIDYYIQHQDAAEAIAVRGWAKVLGQKHTYMTRAQTILDSVGLV